MQRRDAVDGLEAAARGHHIEAVSAVAGDVEVVFGVAVLHHHDEPRPAVGQVVARHALAALRAHERTPSVYHSDDQIQCYIKYSVILHTLNMRHLNVT